MKYILSICLITFALLANAHEYYFAFAEVAYNNETHRFEGTIVVTTHDLEVMIDAKSDGIDRRSLELMNVEDSDFEVFNNEILKGFALKSSGNDIAYSIVGFEVFLTGITNFYFESEIVESPKVIDVYFPLMMDSYPEQQNKIELSIAEKKAYLLFFGETRKQTFNIESSEN